MHPLSHFMKTTHILFSQTGSSSFFYFLGRFFDFRVSFSIFALTPSYCSSIIASDGSKKMKKTSMKLFIFLWVQFHHREPFQSKNGECGERQQ
jgi:hypothetical protein